MILGNKFFEPNDADIGEPPYEQQLNLNVDYYCFNNMVLDCIVLGSPSSEISIEPLIKPSTGPDHNFWQVFGSTY